MFWLALNPCPIPGILDDDDDDDDDGDDGDDDGNCD